MSYNINKLLGYYENLMTNYLNVGEVSIAQTNDPLEQYLYRILSSPAIQEKLENECLQVFFKQQMLHFFRYMLSLGGMSSDSASQQQLNFFERHLTNEMERTNMFLTSQKASVNDFKEMIEFTAGKQWNEQDYLIIRDIKNTCRQYIPLDEIIQNMGRTIGRGTETVSVGNDKAESHSRCHISDIVGIKTGNDITAAIPSEFVYLTSPLLENVFLNKWTEQHLQIFQYQSELPANPTQKGPERHADKGGAMIVCIDTSGSMFGKKEQIAKGIVMELIKTARQQKRPLYLITFAVHVRCMDVTRLPASELYSKFLRVSFSGGTNCQAVLSKALDILQKERFSYADVLCISDFEFEKCTNKILKEISDAQCSGTAFYGLQLGRGYNVLRDIFNKVWQITKI